MQGNDTALFIPARLNSSRLERKMLALIDGKPLIWHTISSANRSCMKGKIYVVTDSAEIEDAVRNTGIPCIQTSVEHLSGSSRIWDGLNAVDPHCTIKTVINLQGDMPFVDPKLIDELVHYSRSGTYDVLTPAIQITDQSRLNDTSVVKVATSFDLVTAHRSPALYFSRLPVPHGASRHYEHLGLYLYKRDALGAFAKARATDVQLVESLEQLQFLHLQKRIDVYLSTGPRPISVDTQSDLDEVRNVQKY